jgi:hypothetical protein
VGHARRVFLGKLSQKSLRKSRERTRNYISKKIFLKKLSHSSGMARFNPVVQIVPSEKNITFK